MRKLGMFNFVTLNGFFKGPNGDISWHRHGGEEAEYSASSLQGGGALLFGRVTYELMASYWPTPQARQQDPATAEGMNRARKFVFSRTMKSASWENTRVLNGPLGEEVLNLKRTSPTDLVILGSGQIVTQLSDLGLIDEYQILVNHVALGEGTPLFAGLKKPLSVKLVDSRAFRDGNLLLTYRPE